MRTIPVFYADQMVAKDNESYSPSAGKPALVVADWIKHGLPIELMPVTPVSRHAIYAAHDRSHVDDVLGCRKPNGFGNTSAEVAAAIPWQIGSLLSASLHVLQRRAGVACSPSSGFHHARYATSSGFCTFNGLIVTAMQLKRLGLVNKVAIFDCDYHAGDGTQQIIDKLGLGKWLLHWSAGLTGASAVDMENLSIDFKRLGGSADLVLYQAGADQHIDDPLGGLLTTEQMLQRDRDVFWLAAEYGMRLVWNLAGGYQRDANGGIEPVLALHRQTMQACADIYLHGQPRKA